VIVGVSVDSTNSHLEFCAKQGLTFNLLAGEKRLSPVWISNQPAGLQDVFA
jgi:peroxiredoxin